MQNVNTFSLKSREFIVVKKGSDFITIKIKNIAYIFTINNLSFIVDQNGNKYITPQRLNDLEVTLPDYFFRANRQYIISAHFIQSFRTYEKSKILLEMTGPETSNKIVISQLNAPRFKEWIFNY